MTRLTADGADDLEYVVIDEFHHAAADSYEDLLTRAAERPARSHGDAVNARTGSISRTL